jgi:hypothetical protein
VSVIGIESLAERVCETILAAESETKAVSEADLVKACVALVEASDANTASDALRVKVCADLTMESEMNIVSEVERINATPREAESLTNAVSLADLINA